MFQHGIGNEGKEEHEPGRGEDKLDVYLHGFHYKPVDVQRAEDMTPPPFLGTVTERAVGRVAEPWCACLPAFPCPLLR